MEKNSQYRYTLRKLSVGLTSVVIGLTFASTATTTVHADTTEQQAEKNEEHVAQTSDTNKVIEQSSDTTSTSKTGAVKQPNTATPEAVEKAKEVTVNTKDATANKNTINNVETEKQTDPSENTKPEIKEDQPKEATTRDSSVKNSLNQEEVAKKQSQPEENKQKVDPELVKSTTDKLSAVEYNVFDLREATELWANDQLKNWYLSDSFKQVHDQLPTLVPQMLDHADNLNTADQRVNDNAAAIMLGMSYINHYYNISFGNKELLPTMMFDPKALGSNLDSIDWLTDIGKLSYNDLLPKNNVDTFNKKLAPMLNTKSDLVTFLGDLRKKWSPELNEEDWFKSNTGVHVVEVPSKATPDVDLSLYHRLATGNDTFKSYILPLLNIKSDDMYVVSTLGMTVFGMYDPYIDVKYHKDPKVYQEKVKEVQAKLDRLAKGWGDHMDFWYRIANDAGKKKLANTNISVWDTYYAKDASKKGGQFWQSKYDTFSPAMAEFFGSVGEKYDEAGISAEAPYGTMVRYYVARVIDDYGGAGILSHEMTHNLDRSVYFDGYGYRPGTNQESYADGLLQSAWNPTPSSYVLNTVLTFDNNYRTTNKGPERFQNREDVVTQGNWTLY